MRISVTREHILQGEQNNPCRCPVALAVQEETQEHGNVTAELTFIRIGEVMYHTPHKVRDWIDRFDYSKNPHRVRAIAFDLDAVFFHPSMLEHPTKRRDDIGERSE